MKMRSWIGVAVLLVLLCVGAKAAPLEAYGQLPTMEKISISPDGNRIAFIMQADAKRYLTAFSLPTDKSILSLNVGDVKFRWLSWAGNTHLLFTTSSTEGIRELMGPRREWFIAQSIDVDKNERRLLMMRPRESVRVLNTVFGWPQTRIVNGHPTAILEGEYFSSNQGMPMLFGEDLVTGQTWFIENHSSNVHDWAVDVSGNAVAEADYSEINKHWTLKLKRDARWSEVYGLDTSIDEPDVEGVSPDGSSLVIRMNDNDETVFKTLNLATGNFGPSLMPEKHFDTVLMDTDTGKIIGAQHTGAQIEYVFFSPHDQEAWDRAVALFPHADVQLQSWSDDRSKIIVHVSGTLDGDAYRLVDLTDGSTRLIGQAYANIDATDIAPVTVITYTAADGRTIPAYLTLPNGRPAKNLPLIVLPHGGPASRDMPGFDWWSQALASRGYAVLQPQFRGSGGWGRDLLHAGFGEFGRKMQTDLSDGVRDLTTKGVIDPMRVCIVGGSYGGYAALAGATLDPGVYRCAVSVAGISDLHEFLSTQYRSDSQGLRYWDRFLGVSGSNDAALDVISPIKHIDKVSIPILLIHGADDTVVPIRQSKLMNDALKRAGKPVQFVEMKGEDHWLSRSETRLQMLRSTVEFLEANNPPN